MLTEEQLDQMTLREIAKQSGIGWLSPAIWTRVAGPLVVKKVASKIPLPGAIKKKFLAWLPITGKIAKWPTPQERAKEMLRESTMDQP